MPNQNKPTKEELEEKIKDAESITDEEIQKEKDELAKIDAEESEVAKKQAEGELNPPEDEPEKETPEVEPEPEPDLKKKLSASARENQKIYAKNRVLNNALVEADDIPEPSDEELQKEYGDDWEVMSDVEKKFAKETELSKRWRNKIKEAKDQVSKIEKWNDEIEKFIDDPKVLADNPELENKQEEFKQFANEETNNSVPFKILVSAFLHEHSAGKKSNKGAMFETGSGGPNDKPQPKSDTISLDDARKIRITDYAKYKELLKAGKITSDL